MSDPSEPDLPAVDGDISAHAGFQPPVADVPKKKKRGLLTKLVFIAILIGGGLWTARFIHESVTYEKTDDAYIIGHIHRISSGISGPLSEVLVDDNQAVKAGQVLAKIDPLEFEIMVERAKAAEEQARSQELQAKAGIAEAKSQDAQADAQIATAAAQLKQAEAQLELAEINYHRNEDLSRGATRAVSTSELDTTRGLVATSSAAVEGAKAGLTASEAKRKTIAATIQAAEATLASAKASIDAQIAAGREANRQLSLVTVTAPSDGRIGNKNAEVGNRIQTGQPLFALVDNDFWIVGNFKETQLAKMKVGQEVEITVDALDGNTFTGKVESISPSTGAQFALLPPDNATGNFTKVVQRVPVKITLDANSIRGYEDRLMPGLSSVVRVKVK